VQDRHQQFWEMKFEAKLRLAKSATHDSQNLFTVPKSVAKCYLLDFANFLIQESEPDIA